jgi:hypothetical protein
VISHLFMQISFVRRDWFPALISKSDCRLNGYVLCMYEASSWRPHQKIPKPIGCTGL